MEVRERIPPRANVPTPRARRVARFICNRQEKSCLGRTCKSWALIGLFYLVFYSCLAIFFAIMMTVFYQTMTPGRPTLINHQNLLKANPAMGFRPQPDTERTSIIFSQGRRETYQAYVHNIQQFLDKYENSNLPDCRADDVISEPSQACNFDLAVLGDECTYRNYFGFDEGTPCVLLKMNKIYGWMPEDFDNGSVPVELQGRYISGNVGVTCEGEEAADRANIGDVSFYPSAGFSHVYFPYANQDGYLQPLVMVRFRRPKNGVLIQVWCRVWAKNIYHDRRDLAGSVHFELMID